MRPRRRGQPAGPTDGPQTLELRDDTHQAF